MELWPGDSVIGSPWGGFVQPPTATTSGPPRWIGNAWPGSAPTADCDEAEIAWVEPPLQPLSLWDGSRLDHLFDRGRELPATVRNDWKNFYSCRGMRDLLLGLGAAAVLANTSLDGDFREWYQERVQTEDTDKFARYWNNLGDGTVVVPAVIGIAAVGTLFDDTASGNLLAQFGSRATRAYLVGAPPVLFGQWALGGARPGESDRESRWSPFQASHAISGHAFIGAVPFITAAKMSDCVWLKGGLYGLSVLPAWARVNRDKHYLSQAVLGWWIACLSCSAVDQTALSGKGYTVFPLLSPDTVGVGVSCPW